MGDNQLLLVDTSRKSSPSEVQMDRTGPKRKLETWRKFCHSRTGSDQPPPAIVRIPSIYKISAAAQNTHSSTVMTAFSPFTRQLGCLRSFMRAQELIQPQINRSISTVHSPKPEPVALPAKLPEQFLSQLPLRLRPDHGMFLGFFFPFFSLSMWLSSI